MKFIDEKRKAQKAITSRVVIIKAKKTTEKLKISDLKCSWGWFTKFFSRNKLSMRAPTTRVSNSYKTLITEAELFIKEFKIYLENRKFQSLLLMIKVFSSLSSRFYFEFL